MRCVTCLFVALYIGASVIRAADPNDDKISTSEKQLASKRGTLNPDVEESGKAINPLKGDVSERN